MSDFVFEDPYTDTESDIFARMLATLTQLFPDPETRPTTRALDLIWTLYSTVASEAAFGYITANDLLRNSFLQFASAPYLDYVAEQYNILRNAATSSAGSIRFFGDIGTIIPINTTASIAVENSEDDALGFSTTTASVVEGMDVVPEDIVTIIPAGITLITEQDGDGMAVGEVQVLRRISLTGGTFTLTFDDDLTGMAPNPQTTANIAFGATSATIITALNALSNVAPGDVIGTTRSNGDVAFTFANAFLNEDIVEIVVDDALTTFTAGPISGDVVYKYVYVTNLYDEDPSFGFTLPSDETDIETLASQTATIEIPDITWSPTNELLDVKEVRVYRSYKGISDVSFSDYKHVATLSTSPESGGRVVDSVTDSAFLLLDTDVIGTGIPAENSTGVVDVPAISDETGIDNDISAGAISILTDETPGITKVINPETFTGASDEETDDQLRVRALEEAQKDGGAGNDDDYVGWAKEIDGIFSAKVLAEWDGPGTVKLVIAGANNSPIADPTKIEEVRQDIAGTIAVANPTDNPISGVAANAGGSMEEGDWLYTYTFVSSGNGETEPDPTYFAITTGVGEDQVTLNNIPLPPAGTGPAVVSARRIYRKLLTDPTPTWKFLVEITNPVTTSYVDVISQASITSTRELPTTNSTSIYDGRAPIGHHLTVVTVTTESIYLTATIVPLTGYSISGESGTTNLTNILNTTLSNFFATLAPGSVVHYKDVENAIHDAEGVEDFRDVLLFAAGYVGVDTNVNLGETSIFEFDVPSTIYTEATV